VSDTISVPDAVKEVLAIEWFLDPNATPLTLIPSL
jgi:hypothetical protein